MKKIMNIRPVFITALAMLVACAFAICVAKSVTAKLVVFIVFAVLFALFVILRFALKIKVFSLLASISLFVALPFLSLFIKANELQKYEKFNSSEAIVVGRILETKLYSESSFYIVLDDAVVRNANESEKVNGKISFYVAAKNLDLRNFEIGRYITVKGDFTFFSLDENGNANSAQKLARGLVAKGSVKYYNIEVSDKVKLTFRDKVRNKVFDKLEKFGGKHFDIGYAMLFGESSAIDDEVTDVFRATGIAHLLAVSGLHVSVIVLAVNFILKKLRFPKALNIVLLSSLLVLYCYLCEFSVSVIRASLMAVFLLFIKMRGKPYDKLTCLSLVAIVVLCISPLQIFSVSFVLSFSAVLSIILIAVPLTRFLSKIFYPKIAGTLALIIAVQLGLFVSTVFYFGRFSLVGILTNFVSVPIASFAFIYLIFALIVSFILPFASAMLGLFSTIMSVVVKFNFWATGLGLVMNFSNMKWLTVIVALVVIYILSDYVFIKRNTKVMASLILLLICTFVNLLFLL